MNFVKILSWVSLILVMLLLGTGYVLGGMWGITLGLIILPLLWWLSKFDKFLWTMNTFLIVATVVAAGGFWLEIPTTWIVSGYLAAFAAWDLGHYARRMDSFHQVPHQKLFVRRHLIRLGGLLAVSGILSAVALLLRVQLSIGLALFLGFFAVVGLSQVLRFARSSAG